MYIMYILFFDFIKNGDAKTVPEFGYRFVLFIFLIY